MVDPDSISHPLAGVVYDPATMSLTAQLAAGVELKEAHLGNMYSDPLEAERMALRANSQIQAFVNSHENTNDVKDEPVELGPVKTDDNDVEPSNN